MRCAPFGMLCLILRPVVNRSGHLRPGRYRQQIIGRAATRFQSSILAVYDSHHHDDELLSGDDIERRLERLNEELTMLNGGEAINCLSPKQVSYALFGKTDLSTSKPALEKVQQDPSLYPAQQRRMASLVLEYRLLRAPLAAETRGRVNSDATPPPPSPKAEIETPSAKRRSQQQVSRPDPNEVPAQRSRESKKSIVQLQSQFPEPVNLATGPSLPTTDTPLDWNDPTSYDRLVENIFADSACKVNFFWKEPLLQLTRQSAKTLVKQLSFKDCPMGYDPVASPIDQLRRSTSSDASSTTTVLTAGTKGSFLAYCREQKEKYPDYVILTRCGDFYETFGIDAILLVEHCGLNPMAGKAKAGCPIRNVQSTLDCLTEAGFRVAVYEEGTDTDSSPVGAKAGAKARIKQRFLSAIVSPASPTYLYDLVLQSSYADSLSSGPQSRPYVGVIASNAGYSLAEVSMEEQTVRMSERLTAEAVACRIAAYPPADPLIYVPAHGDRSSTMPFLPTSGRQIRTKVIPPTLVRQEGTGLCEIERAKHIVVSELLKCTPTQEGQELSAADFALLNESLDDGQGSISTSPLYVETATQLGLMDDKAMPCLVSYLLPTSAAVTSKRFLRRLLLTPPPPVVGEAISTLVTFMKANDGPALPPFVVPPLGKVLSMIRAGQASAQVYSEILKAMQTTILVIDLLDRTGSVAASNALMTVLEFESGMAAHVQSLRARCVAAIAEIQDVLCPIHHVDGCNDDSLQGEQVSDFGNIIPQAFFERNEATWRGRVRQDAAEEAYIAVSVSARRLAEIVARDFWGVDTTGRPLDEVAFRSGSKTPIVQDIFNNIFFLKDIPSNAKDQSIFVHPRDRFGKQIRNRYTTEAVEEALSDYVEACDKACSDVSEALVQLSRRLLDHGHVPAVVQASHSNLILATTFYHAVKANSLGWNVAKAVDDIDDADIASKMQSVWPYWMEKSDAVTNSFDLSGMWVLTAPNMSGKSTIMRSTAAASLLTVCGLCAPLSELSLVRRFDNLFVRGASSDIPTEGKSAFGAEMGDVAALLRCCGKRSLVFVDELGRGTSPKDGTRLAAAVLEAMACAGMSGIFATHLHGIIGLPLQTDRLVWKRMAIDNANDSLRSKWTYRLEEGVCTDSMALTTALQFGLPQHVIDRAEALTACMANDVDGSFKANGLTVSLQTVRGMMTDVCGGKPIVELQPEWNAPASFDGRTTLYALELTTNPKRYYVGETDDIRKRLKQHRAKGEWWAKASALLVVVDEGKSTARSYESSLIRQLASQGIPMQSVYDGRTSRATPRQ
jgi:DNA mismatch repair ATPase MutS